MMTKKDFISLADRMRPLTQIYQNTPELRTFLDCLARFCQDQNPNFNRDRWFGYIDGKCGPNGGRK